MIQFLNYNFISDGNALDPFPTFGIDVENVKVENAYFDAVYITPDVNSSFSSYVPEKFEPNTILLAQFNDVLSAGSIITDFNEIDAVRIKRRKVGEFMWTTLKEVEIHNLASNLIFSGEDHFTESNQEYEYAWVPLSNGNEGEYTIINVSSKFNGVYVCDDEIIYKFFIGVEYGPSQQNQQVGTYNPLGGKYPIYVYNGESNYQTGSVQGKIVGNYEKTNVFDRKEMVTQKNAMLQWLTNKKAKVLKDWNGNIWLISVLNGASVSYDNQWGMGMMDINFQYGEVGDANNPTDLQNVGLLPIIE